MLAHSGQTWPENYSPDANCAELAELNMWSEAATNSTCGSGQEGWWKTTNNGWPYICGWCWGNIPAVPSMLCLISCYPDARSEITLITNSPFVQRWNFWSRAVTNSTSGSGWEDWWKTNNSGWHYICGWCWRNLPAVPSLLCLISCYPDASQFTICPKTEFLIKSCHKFNQWVRLGRLMKN